ncbi:hypothetical protein BDZ91DRAFT_796183 [Kalaharituber pfeilii]|nr:hypothetical protein BDZ91DRAFT_796183 [Kalaharituber pfeilii]
MDYEFGDVDHVGRMNNPQNCMLVRVDLHSLFDDYVIGINPDGAGQVNTNLTQQCDYKIYVFGEDMNGIAGGVSVQLPAKWEGQCT